MRTGRRPRAVRAAPRLGVACDGHPPGADQQGRALPLLADPAEGLVGPGLGLVQRAARRQQRVDEVDQHPDPVTDGLVGLRCRAGLQPPAQRPRRLLRVQPDLDRVRRHLRQAQQGAAVGQQQLRGAVAAVGPGVGERLQHADGTLQKGAVAAQAPLGLQGGDPFQSEPQRLRLVQAGCRAGDRVLPVGAPQQVECAGPVSAPSRVGGGGVQYACEDGALAQGVRRRGGPFGGPGGLPQQRGTALHLPQPQGAARVLAPQLRVGAGRRSCSVAPRSGCTASMTS